LLDKQLAALTQRVRETLESGLSVAIVGWMAKNHNPFTRKLPEKKVVFLGNSPTSLGEKVGLVLFTEYVDHSVVERIKKKKKKMVYPVVVEIWQVKKIFESCKDLLIPPPHNPVVDNAPAVAGRKYWQECARVDMAEKLLRQLREFGEPKK
jgi:hypothetical protein